MTTYEWGISGLLKCPTPFLTIFVLRFYWIVCRQTEKEPLIKIPLCSNSKKAIPEGLVYHFGVGHPSVLRDRSRNG